MPATVVDDWPIRHWSKRNIYERRDIYIEYIYIKERACVVCVVFPCVEYQRITISRQPDSTTSKVSQTLFLFERLLVSSYSYRKLHVIVGTQVFLLFQISKKIMATQNMLCYVLQEWQFFSSFKRNKRGKNVANQTSRIELAVEIKCFDMIIYFEIERWRVMFRVTVMGFVCACYKCMIDVWDHLTWDDTLLSMALGFFPCG